MTEVSEYFQSELKKESDEYSQKLQINMQKLLDKMINNERTVRVSKDFAVRVTDNFDDESKSEGQFAVVSFAYIGGILKMLQSEEHLATKEYPLVLDGPFSKLDADKRQSVVNTIPEFAPQVIILSKDDLGDVLPTERVGKVWTIESNKKQNVSVIKEGRI